jgi:hypothetical protein
MSCTYTDNQIVEQWLECQPSLLTHSCYARDVSRLRAHTDKPLNQTSLGDLLSFAQSLSRPGADLARKDAGGREELVPILPADGLYRDRSRRCIAAATLREPTRRKDDRRKRWRALAVRGGVASRSRIGGPADHRTQAE